MAEAKMLDIPVPSATFKMYPNAGEWGAWLTLNVAEAASPEFVEWCEALSAVSCLDQRDTTDGTYRYTLTFNQEASRYDLHEQILSTIEQLEAKLGYRMSVDDQGVHTLSPYKSFGFIE